MYLFLARVATQMLVILTVTMLGLGFPYTPTQVGLTLFTVGLPTFFLTIWARPKPPDDDLLVSLARFVLPVGVLTAGFATAVYAYLYQLVTAGLTRRRDPGPAIGMFERYTGLTYDATPTSSRRRPPSARRPGCRRSSRAPRSCSSSCSSRPHRLFTAWAPVERRPAPHVARARVCSPRSRSSC